MKLPRAQNKMRSPESASIRVGNRMLMRDTRLQRGWTQAEFAKAAGLSLRVVVKAEAGETISRETIGIIAKTLSTEHQPFDVRDLQSCPVSVVQHFCNAFYLEQDAGLADLSHWLCDDVKFEIIGDTKKFPFAGLFHGLEEVLKYRNLFFDIVSVPAEWRPPDHLTYVPHHFELAVWGKRSLIHRGTQIKFDSIHSQLYRFRHGKIISMKEIFDTGRFADLA